MPHATGFRPLTLLLMLSIGTTLGCNRPPQPTYPAKGVVQWSDGQPATELTQGRLELQVIEGPTIRVSPHALLQDDATFVLQTYKPADGAPAGKYRAVIIPWAPPVDGPTATPPLLDSRWQSFAESPMQVTIEPKPNELVLMVDRAKRR